MSLDDKVRTAQRTNLYFCLDNVYTPVVQCFSLCTFQSGEGVACECGHLGERLENGQHLKTVFLWMRLPTLQAETYENAGFFLGIRVGCMGSLQEVPIHYALYLTHYGTVYLAARHESSKQNPGQVFFHVPEN